MYVSQAADYMYVLYFVGLPAGCLGIEGWEEWKEAEGVVGGLPTVLEYCTPAHLWSFMACSRMVYEGPGRKTTSRACSRVCSILTSPSKNIGAVCQGKIDGEIVFSIRSHSAHSPAHASSGVLYFCLHIVSPLPL